jgi:hypothetical protein
MSKSFVHKYSAIKAPIDTKNGEGGILIEIGQNSCTDPQHCCAVMSEPCSCHCENVCI